MRSRITVYSLPQGVLHISKGNITSFPGTSFISEWKLGWIVENVSPSALCLAQTPQV